MFRAVNQILWMELFEFTMSAALLRVLSYREYTLCAGQHVSSSVMDHWIAPHEYGSWLDICWLCRYGVHCTHIQNTHTKEEAKEQK